MSEFVELWVYLASTPLFGLTATVATYVVAQAAYERLDQAPWANPVLWSVIAIGGVLLITRTPYPSYFSGAQFIHVLLGPAVVALGWPLWQRRAALRAHGLRFVAAGVVGSGAAVATVLAGGWLLDLPQDVLRSLVPKSVTAPVAMGLAERLGGVPAMAAVFAVLTGMVGALSARALFGLMRLDDWRIRGFALGTASHGIGAARAMQVHPDAGAYAGLALALQVLMSCAWLPLLAWAWPP